MKTIEFNKGSILFINIMVIYCITNKKKPLYNYKNKYCLQWSAILKHAIHVAFGFLGYKHSAFLDLVQYLCEKRWIWQSCGLPAIASKSTFFSLKLFQRPRFEGDIIFMDPNGRREKC